MAGKPRKIISNRKITTDNIFVAIGGPFLDELIVLYALASKRRLFFCCDVGTCIRPKKSLPGQEWGSILHTMEHEGMAISQDTLC